MNHYTVKRVIAKMSYTTIVLAFVLAVLPVMGKTVRLKVSTYGIPAGTIFELYMSSGSKLNLIQQYTSKDILGIGFDADVDVTEPTLYVLQPQSEGVNPPQLQIMVEPSDTQINLKIGFDKELNYIELMSTSGSKNMVLMKEFNSIIYASLPALRILNDEYAKVKGNGVNQRNKKQSIDDAYIVLASQMNRKIKQIISENTDCLMAAYLMTYFENEPVRYADLYEKVLKGLESSYSSNVFVDRLRTTITAINGAKAPEIAMPDKDGRIRKLSSLRGKVVLIDFCASWCGHCRKEIPDIVRLYRKYKNKGFDIYSISLDDDREKWLNYIKESGQEWENHVSELKWDCSAAKTYGIKGAPRYILVDRKGRIISTITNDNARVASLTALLEEVFDEYEKNIYKQ